MSRTNKAALSMIDALIERGLSPESAAARVLGEPTVASSPVAATTPIAPAPTNGFLAHAAAVKAARIERGYARCEQPKCSGVMHPDRTTVIRGKRACGKHFGRRAR